MQEKKKFYQAKWFLWLFLIIFPPIGIILIWAVHKDMKKNKKIILTVIFAIWFIILMAATSGEDSTSNPNTDNQQETQATQKEEETTKNELPEMGETVCRAMTKTFVEDVVGEDYSMLAFSIEEYDIDENENGTIKVLYFPSDAGNGATKVNLTISKNENTYEIKYALLAGINEVDLEQVSEEHKVFVYTE